MVCGSRLQQQHIDYLFTRMRQVPYFIDAHMTNCFQTVVYVKCATVITRSYVRN